MSATGRTLRGMDLVVTVTLFVLVVLAVTWLAERLRWSAPLLLLLVGVLGSVLPFVHVPVLEPEFVLAVLLPPLLYSSAVNTSLVDFRANLTSIGWLSVGLVLVTLGVVGVVVWWVLGVPLPAALALGAIVAPPDAVAATAVARRVGLPRRVVTLLEGESLVNDATALVSLRSALVALSAALSVGAIVGDFAWAVASAVAIGFVVARLGGFAFRLLPNSELATSLTFLVPFAAYVPTEEVHGSGVLAVVVAGLVLGHRSHVDQGPEDRVAARITWRTLQFLLEHAVFLLIGLQARTIWAAAAASAYSPALIAATCVATVATVIGVRLAAVLATYALTRRRREAPSLPGALVVGWAGMRGVVTLAAALSLPQTVPARDVLILTALVVTASTLLLQGLTLPWLARRVGLRGPDPREDAIEEAMILQRASAAAFAAVGAAASEDERPHLADLRERQATSLNAVWERLGRPGVDTPASTRGRLYLRILQAQREEILRLRESADVDQAVVASVLAQLDVQETIATRINERADTHTPGERLSVGGPGDACGHLADAPACVAPLTPDGCPECAAEGLRPVHLRLCLACGHVGCCDSSAGRHARRHFDTTGHPVMRSFEPGESWRWCYVDDLIGR